VKSRRRVDEKVLCGLKGTKKKAWLLISGLIFEKKRDGPSAAQKKKVRADYKPKKT